MRLFIATSEQVYVLADNIGYINTIEKAGGAVVSGICIQGFPYPQLIDPANTAATNSARAASYQIRRKINIQYGSTEDCINAAITGANGGLIVFRIAVDEILQSELLIGVKPIELTQLRPIVVARVVMEGVVITGQCVIQFWR